jgi:integrase
MDYKYIFGAIERRDVAQEHKDTAKAFLEAQIAAGLSICTLKGRVVEFFQVIKWLENRPLEIFKEEAMFNSYVVHMKLKGLKENTVNTNKILLKRLLIWAFKGVVPAYFKEIKYPKTKNELLENALIKPSEIKSMVEKAANSRDKALVITLYETGARISELLNVHIKDVEFREQETIIKILTSKTKKREIPVFDSTPHLLKWINEHPFKDTPDAFVFMSLASNYYGHMLQAPTVGRRLKHYAKLAGVNKHVHCHLFRHSRISWWAKAEKLNERDLRLLCGWSEKSDMPNTYIHYNIDGVLEKMKRQRGIISTQELEQEKETQSLKPIFCPRCNKENPTDSMFCNCGMALSHKSILHLEEIRTKESELHQEILSKSINNIQLNDNTDIKETLYQMLKSDPSLVEKLKHIIILNKEVTP